MSMFKIAIAGVSVLTVAVVSTSAIAQPVRSAAATPGLISVNKVKALRTAAPTTRESREVSGEDIGLGLLAAGAAGFGIYEATKSDSSGG